MKPFRFLSPCILFILLNCDSFLFSPRLLIDTNTGNKGPTAAFKWNMPTSPHYYLSNLPFVFAILLSLGKFYFFATHSIFQFYEVNLKDEILSKAHSVSIPKCWITIPNHDSFDLQLWMGYHTSGPHKPLQHSELLRLNRLPGYEDESRFHWPCIGVFMQILATLLCMQFRPRPQALDFVGSRPCDLSKLNSGGLVTDRPSWYWHPGDWNHQCQRRTWKGSVLVFLDGFAWKLTIRQRAQWYGQFFVSLLWAFV